MAIIDPRQTIDVPDEGLEKLFRQYPTQGIEGLINGGEWRVDLENRRIFNDANWRGFLPRGLPLGDVAGWLNTGYYKRIWKEGEQYLGETRYLDGRIGLNHALEEFTLDKRVGDLDPGRYILLRYTDAGFEQYYDVMKLISDEIVLYRGYTGKFPHGRRGWTAPLLRDYGFEHMSAEDHRRLWEAAARPSPEALEGEWRMDAVANANHSVGVARVTFTRPPKGSMEIRHQFFGPEITAVAWLVASHFQLDNFTAIEDEIRELDRNYILGRWVSDLPEGLGAAVPEGSVGLLHTIESQAGRKQFGFWYTLTRVEAGDGARVRARAMPDTFSTRPTPELQAILRDQPTLGLESLLNRGEVRIDFERRRIHRDSFWKGSFAKDNLLGWEEMLRTTVLGGDAERMAGTFAGGSFWKRFDRIEGGKARGHVVNYELDLIPGDPEVREVNYPDDRRPYFRKGDRILLLNYRNEPYRIVYDAIKVIDEDNAVGVMHLGEFPNGLEFATFVMARNNYPFEKMSVPDHCLLFEHSRARVPRPEELMGTWEGSLVFLDRPDESLLNQANPGLLRVSFEPAGGAVRVRYALGAPEFEIQEIEKDAAALGRELRRIDEETLIGKWSLPELGVMLPRFVLRRV
jgi:hypothetical protein